MVSTVMLAEALHRGTPVTDSDEYTSYVLAFSGIGSCTAVALSAEWALTAAYCVNPASSGAGYAVYTGAERLQHKGYKVDAVKVAPMGDLALVHLTDKLPFEQYPELPQRPFEKGDVV